MAVRPTDPEALHLFQLIGAPLLAVIQAEAQAAQVSADFIHRIGFEAKTPEETGTQQPGTASTAPAEQDAPSPAPPGPKALQEGGDVGKLRVAEFTLDRYAADGTPQPYVVRAPVLSLFPIPLLQIKHADFEFDIRILSRVPLEDPHEGQPDTQLPSLPSTDYLAKNRIELKGFLASSRRTARSEAVNDASIKLRVRMEQSDMPAGLIRLMNMMGENVTVTPKPLNKQTQSNTQAGTDKKGKPHQP